MHRVIKTEVNSILKKILKMTKNEDITQNLHKTCKFHFTYPRLTAKILMLCVNKNCHKAGYSFVIYSYDSGTNVGLTPEIKLLKTHLSLKDCYHYPHFKDK